MKNNILKIIFFLPFLLIIFLLLEYINTYTLIKYNIGFVSICITIATFSISFSFLQYQFSPYKALLRTISIRQLLFSYITLLIALIPLFSLFYDENLVPTLGLICIPTLSYFVILLVIIANEETNPLILIKRNTSKSSLNNFINNFKSADDTQIAEINKLEFSKPDEMPMHDYGETNFKLIHTRNNPFAILCHTVTIAIQNNDIEKFESVIKLYFQLVNTTLNNNLIKKYELTYRIEKLICLSFEKICLQTASNKERKDFQNILIGSFAIFIKNKALTNNQTDSISRRFCELIVSHIESILEQDNYEDSLIIISTFRQICQKGIHELSKSNDVFFIHGLALYPNLIKKIGQKAVDLKNSDFLFRCLEELGYLGCTSIKQDNHVVGVECLHSLVQLGRESRAKNLKCFWRNCALEPIEHAEQRIWWILSWLLKVPENNRQTWIESFETAYSRLRGKQRQITMTDENGKAIFKFNDSKESHIERYSEETYTAEIDYSNFTELKEFKLY